MNRTYTTDVLIIGAGLAGERIAVAAAHEGLDVILLSLVPRGGATLQPRRRHAGCPGERRKGKGDNTTIHWMDTVKGSDWGPIRRCLAFSRIQRHLPCVKWPISACRGTGSWEGPAVLY